MKRLFPLPRHVSETGVRHPLSSRTYESGFPSEALAARLADGGFRPGPTPYLHLTVNPALEPEGYRLAISAGNAEIEAATPAGAYYGFVTLSALLEGETLPECVVEDAPALALRSFHLTLGSGYMPTFDWMRRFIIRLGELKINMLVLEYDDRFPWERHPALVAKGTFSKAQLRELIELARDHFVEIMPLVDSLGHAEQYLIHPEYAHLKELPDEIAEMCPSNPATFDFITELWEEVLELHPESRYAHITGDEVFRLGGFCPQCAKRHEDGTLSQLYVDYYTRLSRWIIERGKIPVVWGDMLLKYPEALAAFPRDVVITEWSYYGPDAPHWPAPDMQCNPEGKCPPEREKLFRPYWGEGPEFTSYPFVRFFTEQGFQVIGATASSLGLSGGGYTLPCQASRVVNQREMALKLAENHSLGFMNTFWSNSVAPEGAWAAIYAGADFAWHPREEKTDDFLRDFEATALGGAEGFCRSIDRLEEPALAGAQRYAPLPSPAVTLQDPFLREYVELARLNLELGNLDREAFNFAIARFLGDPVPTRRTPLPFITANAGASNVFSEECFPLPLPGGMMEYGGVVFTVDPERRYSTRPGLSPAILSVRMEADEFELLTAAYYNLPGEPGAIAELRYGDGSHCEIVLKGNDDLGDWWGGGGLGRNRIPYRVLQLGKGFPVALHLTRLANPHPGKRVEELCLRSAGTKTVVAVFGVNAVKRTATPPPPLSKEKADEWRRRLRENIGNQRTFFARLSLPEDFEEKLDRLLQGRRALLDIF